MFRLSSRTSNICSKLSKSRINNSNILSSQVRWSAWPDYHPKDLRYYHLTEDEFYALVKMDDFGDIPFPMDSLPGFSAAPTARTTYGTMSEPEIEYLMQKLQDNEDPGPVFDPYARFNKKPDPDTEPDAVIVAINGVVVDLKLKTDVKAAVWDAFEVRGTESRIVMEVACWEGENTVRYDNINQYIIIL